MGKYEKPHKSIDDQVETLVSRGMQGDPTRMAEALATVNYYRLSGYWFPFRQEDGVSFVDGTDFGEVWSRYVLDRQVRLLVMDAIERIEVAVRTCLAYHHSREYGPFGYMEDDTSLPGLRGERHAEFIAKVKVEHARSSKEQFVEHFDSKYGDSHDCLPVWIAVEIMSFGSLLTFYNGAEFWLRHKVAKLFMVPEQVMSSWLTVLNMVRNICAHHGRLWNRKLGVRPVMPTPSKGKYSEWVEPVTVNNERLFSVLTICQHCLRQVAKGSKWQGRLERLIAPPVSSVVLEAMGFPKDWNLCPIWKRS